MLDENTREWRNTMDNDKELMKGSIDILILSLLALKEMYGYERPNGSGSKVRICTRWVKVRCIRR
jgi:hypothetical protein